MFSNLPIIVSIWSILAIFLLRVVFGFIFIGHGWPKLKNLSRTQQQFEEMGLRPGALWGTIVALLESVGGVLVLFGIFTQFFSILFAIEMFFATAMKIRAGKGFVNGYEFDLLLLAVALTLAAFGGWATYPWGIPF